MVVRARGPVRSRNGTGIDRPSRERARAPRCSSPDFRVSAACIEKVKQTEDARALKHSTITPLTAHSSGLELRCEPVPDCEATLYPHALANNLFRSCALRGAPARPYQAGHSRQRRRHRPPHAARRRHVAVDRRRWRARPTCAAYFLRARRQGRQRGAAHHERCVRRGRARRPPDARPRAALVPLRGSDERDTRADEDGRLRDPRVQHVGAGGDALGARGAPRHCLSGAHRYACPV